MSKPIKPSELLEFVAQSPLRDDDDDENGFPAPVRPDRDYPRVIVVGFKVPFSGLVAFLFKLMLAIIPIAAVIAAAVYFTLKFLPKLL